MKLESIIYFVYAFEVIGVLTFICILYKIFITKRIMTGLLAATIWIVLSLGMMLMHIVISIGVAHAPPNQSVGIDGVLKTAGIHLAYLLIGIGLVYWIGKRNLKLH